MHLQHNVRGALPGCWRPAELASEIQTFEPTQATFYGQPRTFRWLFPVPYASVMIICMHWITLYNGKCWCGPGAHGLRAVAHGGVSI